MTTIGQRIWSALLGEERPRDMLVLLTILVALLHVWMLSWLIRSVEKTTEAVPLVMEVSMISISAPKSVEAPPKPAPPPPPPEQKPLPIKKAKAKPKPIKKKPAPAVVQEIPDFAPFKPFEPVEQPQQTNNSANASSESSRNAAKPSENTQTFTEANFRANYAHNPKPHYPAIAKSRGWQGKVLLRVKVSVQGLSEAVTVEQSSGHEILDESAIEAVSKWRFIPAKRGDTPVASSVIVPIVFTLRN
ncbi:energy transducer TonB [Methylomonas sp. MgM2]